MMEPDLNNLRLDLDLTNLRLESDQVNLRLHLDLAALAMAYRSSYLPAKLIPAGATGTKESGLASGPVNKFTGEKVPDI